MFKKLLKALTGTVLGFTVALVISYASFAKAEVAAVLDTINRAFFVALDGHNLILGTEDDDDVIVRQDSVDTLAIDGTTYTAEFTGHVDLKTTGKTLILEDGTAASTCVGSLTLTAATPVVTSTTCAETGDYIFLTRTSIDADTSGDMAVTALSNGVSFSVTSEANDTATVNWIIIKGQ